MHNIHHHHPSSLSCSSFLTCHHNFHHRHHNHHHHKQPNQYFVQFNWWLNRPLTNESVNQHLNCSTILLLVFLPPSIPASQVKNNQAQQVPPDGAEHLLTLMLKWTKNQSTRVKSMDLSRIKYNITYNQFYIKTEHNAIVRCTLSAVCYYIGPDTGNWNTVGETDTNTLLCHFYVV